MVSLLLKTRGKGGARPTNPLCNSHTQKKEVEEE